MVIEGSSAWVSVWQNESKGGTYECEDEAPLTNCKGAFPVLNVNIIGLEFVFVPANGNECDEDKGGLVW